MTISLSYQSTQDLGKELDVLNYHSSAMCVRAGLRWLLQVPSDSTSCLTGKMHIDNGCFRRDDEPMTGFPSVVLQYGISGLPERAYKVESRAYYPADEQA
jgi:hypothetical protein